MRAKFEVLLVVSFEAKTLSHQVKVHNTHKYLMEITKKPVQRQLVYSTCTDGDERQNEKRNTNANNSGYCGVDEVRGNIGSN